MRATRSTATLCAAACFSADVAAANSNSSGDASAVTAPPTPPSRMLARHSGCHADECRRFNFVLPPVDWQCFPLAALSEYGVGCVDDLRELEPLEIDGLSVTPIAKKKLHKLMIHLGVTAFLPVFRWCGCEWEIEEY